MIIYPDAVVNGSKIGVTAMSAGIDDERSLVKTEAAIQKLTNKGFKIVETPDLRTHQKFVSATAEIRSDEFLSLWEREDISYMPIAFGGEFLMETIPYLHHNKNRIICAKPKWVQGFSDVSLLLFYLTTNYNIATVHTYSFSAYAMNKWHKSIEMPFKFVTNPCNFTQESFEEYEKDRNREIGAECNSFNLTEKVEYKSLFGENSVKMNGRLIGGCMDVIKVLLGTPYDNTKSFCSNFKEGMLWYLENCEMPITDVKRTLWQMRESGWFNNANGFLIGRTANCTMMDDFTYEDALKDVLEELGVPVVYNVDIGHVAPQWTMINGAFAEFSYENGKGMISQKMI